MTTIWGIAHREIGKRTAASWVDERVFGTFAEAYMEASVLRAAETEYEKHLSGDHGKYVRREFTVLLRWGDEPVWPTQAVLVDFEGRVQDPLRCIPGLDARFAARASGHESNPTSVDNDSSGPIIVDANGRHVELRNGESVTLHQEDVACERCGQASRDIFRLNNEHLGCPKCIDTARKEVAAAHEAIDAFFGDPRTEARAITAAANHVSLAYAKHAVGSVPPLYVDTDSIYTDETRSAARDARSEGGFRALEAVALSVILGPEDTSKMISLMLRIHEAEERAASAEDRLAQVLARDERSRLAVANAARDPRYAGSGRLIDLDALDLAKSWAPEDLAKVEALLVRVTAAEGRVMSAEARADLADERAKEKNDWPVAFRQPGERIPLEALRPEDFKEGEKGTSIYGLVVRKTLAEARVVELEAENARLREQAVSAGERASCLGDRCGTLEAEAADLKRQLKARR